MSNQKGEIMSPEQMREMTAEKRATSKLYSKTTDNGEVVSVLTANLAADLAHLPQKIDLTDTGMVTAVAIDYVKACCETGTIPSKSGYCRACGISRQSLDYFLNHHGDEPSAEKIRLILDGFAELLNNAALANACHPVMSIFLSKALYGYVEKLSIEAEPMHDPLGERKDTNDILAKYKDVLDMLPN